MSPNPGPGTADTAAGPEPRTIPHHGPERDARRRELAAFLRSRRERITPEDVGLPPGRRRRTPGLRREEVAELAAVGVTWYTWLEQGRDIRASRDVLDAIARSLRLTHSERGHLFALAGVEADEHHHHGEGLEPQVRAILDALDPLPAIACNARTDVLAWNSSYAAVLFDFESVPVEERNLLWLAFTSPAWRRLLVEYDDDVRRMVARFRAAMGHHVGEPEWSSLVERLQDTSPAFVPLWERHEVLGVIRRTKQFLNPMVGIVRLDHTALRTGEVPECEIRVYTPADEESRASIDRLLAMRSAGRAPVGVGA